MATNEVEIQVIVESKEAEKSFEKLEESAEGVGESFTSVGKAVSNLGEEASKSLKEVGDSANNANKAFLKLNEDTSNALTEVGKSIEDLEQLGGDLGKLGGDLEKLGGKFGKLGGDLGKLGGEFGKSIGLVGKSVGKAAHKVGNESTKALGDVGSSIGDVVDSFSSLSKALKSSGVGFSSLLGPIGLVAVAVTELYSAYKEYSHEIDGTNIRIEAFKASATELTSIIERLSDAQINLNLETIKAFRIQSQRAQVAIEEAEGLNQKATALRINIENEQKQIKITEESIRKAKEQAKFNIGASTVIAGLEANKSSRLANIAKLQERLDKITTKADKKALEGNKQRQVTEKMLQDQLKQSPEATKKRAEQEAKILSEARVNELQATKNTLKTQKKIATIASKQKIAEIKAIEDISETVRSQAIKGERKRLQAEISDIEKGFAEKRRQEAEKRTQRNLAMQARQDAIALMNERKLQSELNNIRKLELEGMRINGASARELLQARYNDELAKAKDNANLKIAAQMRYQNELTKLEQSEEQARLSQEQAFAEQRQAFIESTIEFNISRIKDETQRELALLELRYDKEIQLNAHTQDQITELQRRATIEREAILNASFDRSMEKLQDMGQELASSSLGAVYQSIVNAGQYDIQLEELKYKLEQDLTEKRQDLIEAQRKGDVEAVRQREQEITDITATFEAERRRIRTEQGQQIPMIFGNILKGLGEQAAIEAMLETARGIATAFTAPALSANHFAAAGVFAAAAVAAGTAGAAITNKASGKIAKASRGAGSESPTGTPQTAPSPQREKADSQPMVFNINFGGAVIYDTQRAAEQALADRITTLQNTHRRGAPRRRFG